MEKINTIIIGAGPSGLAAAQVLKNNNIDYCIIEKNFFPRLKLCGGLLTQKTLEMLNELDFSIDNSDIKKNIVKDFEIIDNNKTILSIKCDDDFVLVDRIDLDNYMVNKFKANGGNIKEGEKVTDIDLEQQIVHTDKASYKYENLICADGATGFSSKYIKNKKYQKAFCIEVSIPYEKLTPASPIKLDTGIFKKGYGWVFPKANSLCIGIGAMDYKDIDYTQKFIDFASAYTSNIDKTKLKGAFLPFGKCDGIISQKNGHILLVGDAAGFIDVTTGEGIYFALRTGSLAAQSIVEGNNDFDKITTIYKEKTKKYVELANRSDRIISTFYKFKKLFYKIANRDLDFVKHFCKVQIARNEYNYDVFKILSSYKKKKRN